MRYFTQRTVSLIREGGLVGAAKISTFQVQDDSEVEGTHKDHGAQLLPIAAEGTTQCYQTVI